jgi:glycosyltransferase involved in cell wall biosynthesis
LRVLIAGWVNSPHLISWAKAVGLAGHEVHLTGRVVPGWPPPRADSNLHLLSFDGPPLIRSFRMSRDLADVAANVAPDLIHAHWLPEFGWMAAREGLRPLICSAWGSDALLVRGLQRYRSKQALEGADLVLASAAHVARASRDLASRDVPIEVVRWGLDLERFAPGDSKTARKRLGVKGDGALIVNVRGLRAIYNPVLLIEAFSLLLKSRGDARLLLLNPSGEDPPAMVTRAIERLGLSGAVMIRAVVGHDVMPDVYRAADVVVSVSSSEGSPRSVWEALACGRPVVVSDLPWARDELRPGREAVFVPLERDAIADAIERLLDDRSFARRLSESGRESAVRELDPSLSAARIDQFYRSVLEPSR